MKQNLSFLALLRAKLEEVVDEYLKEDDQLILQDDTNIVEAVYARMGTSFSSEFSKDAEKDLLLPPTRDSVGELNEYDLSYFFATSEGNDDHNTTIMTHAISTPMLVHVPTPESEEKV
ncbi:hypothetical protein GOP47_0020161 [Adiantum capillus-veneris]|uniref:Uncharacterized protein n=1 Tax=Adiantum capillus-veneris TaxID=13818 RepID=A0A9D4UCH3_ADICA|nr:hypothetical protein GOP47_0020161 [Adiantum capillus-veneris]